MEKNFFRKSDNSQELVCIKNNEDKNLAFEQYKVLARSLDYTNEIRESSNSFWISINSLLISGIAYLRGFQDIDRDKFSFLMWSSLVLGMCFCLTWLNSLISIKTSINTRNRIMIEIEKDLPAKVFTACLGRNQNVENKRSITIKEMIVPCIFLLGYGFFIILLLWLPNIILGKD